MTILVLTSLMLAAPTLVAAQAASTPMAGMNAGLQQAVNRNYAAPGIASMAMAAMSGTPMATPSMAMASPVPATASPVASPTTGAALQTASGFIFQYQTGDQAKNAFASDSETIFDAFNKRFTAQTKITLAKDSVTGVGNAANAWSGSGQVEGVTLSVFAIVTYYRNDVYFTVLVAKGSNAKDATVSFTKALIAVPAGGGTGTFNKNGTSTGGLWDKFPKKGDPVLQGMEPINDMQLH